MRRIPLLLLLVAAVACGDGAAPDRRTIIDSRDAYDPRSLDPLLATDVPTGRVVSYVFDALVRATPSGDIEPGLAERWDVSGDGRLYTFHIRPGVRFHDGSGLTSRTVVRSFERLLDPAERGARGWPLYPIRGARAYAEGRAQRIEGLSAPDDSTVVIALGEPLAFFPKLLAMPVTSIVPDSIPSDFGQRPIGTGPWRLVRWAHDDFLLFAANTGYFGGRPRADSLLARVIPEPSTAVAEFESRNVDILNVPEGESRRWRNDESRAALLHTAPGLRVVYVAINTQRGPLRNPRVRQALNLALDSRAILEQLLGGRGTISAGVIPPSLPGADASRRPYGHDAAAARRLLAEAGYPNGIDVELWSSQTPPFPRIAETIQSYLSQAGISVRLVQREAAATREASRAGQADMVLKDWFADYPDAENFLYPLLHSANHGVGGNVSFYSSSTFDDIVNRARRERDDSTRHELYRQADSVAFADAPMIFIAFSGEMVAVQPWIDGFEVPVIFYGQRFTGVGIRR